MFLALVKEGNPADCVQSSKDGTGDFCLLP